MAEEADLLARIVELIDDRTAKGIAGGISRMVSAGELPSGMRLPTVRSIAAGLGVSPTTVSQAWRSLTSAGMIVSRGSGGSFVAGVERLALVRRVHRTYESPGQVALDLSTGIPDPALLPDLGPALDAARGSASTTSYVDPPVLPLLEEILRADWPYGADGMTVVNGALDGLSLVTAQLVRLGDPVLVENPGFPPLIDILEMAGADILGIDLDEEGLRADSLRSALSAHPVALYLQPRAQNPAGVSMSERRAEQIARLLKGTDVVVVEDDHASYISESPLVSLGRHFARQTIHIRSFSKSHGPDLRIAALGGPADLIERVNLRRLLSSGWTSRILQAILVHLLTHEPSQASVDAARVEYARRRHRMVELLAAREVSTTGRDGINLWISVKSQQRALIQLAAAGIGVAPGTPFVVGEPATDHIRLTVGLVDEEDSLRVANAVALAASSGWARVGGGRPGAGRAVR